MKPVNRRNFIRTGAASIAGLALTKNTNAASTVIEQSNSKIIKRKLGNTGLEIPVLSMGVGRCDSPSVVKGALKMGITHFDTAYRYQEGNSEKMLGEILKDQPRDSFVIATKLIIQDSKEKFLALLDESLERLQMDYVDILYFHGVWDRESALNEGMLDALKTAKEMGKTKHIGLSTHKSEPEVIQAAIDSDVYEVVLTSYNFKQEHVKEMQEKINLAADKGIGIIAMKVMAGGFLDKDKTMPVNYKAALKWCLQNENVCTTIPSLNNLEQLMDNAPVLENIKLTEQETKDLAFAGQQTGIYCNGCSQCVPNCKKNLPIPEIMRAYMYAYGYKETLKAKELIASLNLKNNPCGDCTICTTSCIKNFKLSEKITDVSRINAITSDFLT